MSIIFNLDKDATFFLKYVKPIIWAYGDANLKWIYSKDRLTPHRRYWSIGLAYWREVAQGCPLVSYSLYKVSRRTEHERWTTSAYSTEQTIHSIVNFTEAAFLEETWTQPDPPSHHKLIPWERFRPMFSYFNTNISQAQQILVRYAILLEKFKFNRKTLLKFATFVLVIIILKRKVWIYYIKS